MMGSSRSIEGLNAKTIILTPLIISALLEMYIDIFASPSSQRTEVVGCGDVVVLTITQDGG